MTFTPDTNDNQSEHITLTEAQDIARDAYIYGFPIVDNMRIQYTYFVDQQNPEYKAPYNQIFNIPRVYTPDDKTIQTPNSDTPYSWIGLDLRSEPIVFTIPPIGNNRYWSLQLIDLYTHNFDYLGSRTTGNDGGSFAVAGTDSGCVKAAPQSSNSESESPPLPILNTSTLFSPLTC